MTIWFFPSVSKRGVVGAALGLANATPGVRFDLDPTHKPHTCQMSNSSHSPPEHGAGDAVVEWLLDSDPSIRWQVLRDLTSAPADVVAAERSRVATEGWG